AARRASALPPTASRGRGLVAVAIAVSTIGLLAWGGIGALVITQRRGRAGVAEPARGPAAPRAAAAGADQFSQVTAPPTTQPRPTGPATTEPATTEPTLAAGSLGDQVVVSDEFGDAQVEVTVTKVKFSTGDEFEQPEHGLFM